ncbi:MAG: tetratricopeptide repeat protein, partial [Tannerella sp.]|nr:tetratricopeptide repeat protein [Tannerella sp.]
KLQETPTPAPFHPATEGVADEPLIFEPTSIASVDYTRMLTTDDTPAPAASTPQFQHQELIDSFILRDQSRSAMRNRPEPVKTGSNSEESAQESDLDDQTLDNTYFTETLANIYIKQKRYEKALEIIKSLNLKYPEKSIYFADQIRYLEKLIIHTKK